MQFPEGYHTGIWSADIDPEQNHLHLALQKYPDEEMLLHLFRSMSPINRKKFISVGKVFVED